MQTRVAAKERALSAMEGRASGWASGPIVHARGWVGSLLKCKPEFFFPRDGETGGGRRGESPRGDSADDAIPDATPDATLRRAD